MNQERIGCFIKSLRLERGITQEQLAEALGVTNRSVSRWENGNNLPDLSVLLELAKYFDVDVGELLDGGRKEENMDKQTEDTIRKAADYEQFVNKKLMRKLHWVLLLGVAAMAMAFILEESGLTAHRSYMILLGFLRGAAFGTLIGGVVYTSRFMSRIIYKVWVFKTKLLDKKIDKE